jgi:hypothetical protein
LNGISLLIEKMEGQKRQLHPDVCADPPAFPAASAS